MKLANIVKVGHTSIKVIQNTAVPTHQWGQIKSKAGLVLHTGQLPYLRRVARKKYGAEIEFVE